MKKYNSFLILIVLLVISLARLYGQGENNIWTFGRNYSLNFNFNPPLLLDDRYLNGTLMSSSSPPSAMSLSEHNYEYSQAVCNASGELLFLVKKYTYSSVQGPGYGTYTPNLFDRDEQPIPGTEFLWPLDMAYDRPMVIPHPGNPNQYYIFYVRNGGLIYCLFDMTLNGGRGDIVPGQKNVLHYSYNSIYGNLLAAIQGCDGIWLITRHKIYKQFLAFKIDRNGLAAHPVVSVAGQMPLGEYDTHELVASPDGKMLGIPAMKNDLFNYQGGIELFKFDKCSGKVEEDKLFESGNVIYGLAFSPDNSKLYALYNLPKLYPTQPQTLTEHNIYQFDLMAGSTADIVSSKTLVLSNPIALRWGAFCPPQITFLGAMRNGKDGKIYLTNGQEGVCAGGGVGMAIHLIEQPNLPGLACSPVINEIYNTVNGMVNSKGRTSFPYEMVLPPVGILDTITASPLIVDACFKNDTVLKAPPNVSCIEWSTGSGDSSLIITETGKYWVRYTRECTTYVDSFDVRFSKMPKIAQVQYGCPGLIILKAGNAAGGNFDMEVYNSLEGKIYGGINKPYHETSNLDEGDYKVKIVIGGVCDTILNIHLKAYPEPEITIDPSTASIKLGEEIVLKAEGGMNYSWTPASSLNVRTSAEVSAKPDESTRYTVVGRNEYGCIDSAFVDVQVDFNKHIVLPNAFTPNGDGKNDVFTVPAGNWKILRFEVYNRFGQTVYQYSDNDDGWNGSFKGIACDAGVYFYGIVLSMPDKTQQSLKGEIHLIR
ncbi:gliding motility-associated C-terminal domain-containing protein [Sphingobacterium siyangense]|uniref:gliding motility-associated C-terminal domain-containing protein n=1 Tax=Sphingobacterium siyangense TaxID=459529 RepID=UPI0030198180